MTDTERQLRPCLAELLRTCIKPSSMVLQVDKTVTQANQETMADSANLTCAPQISKTVTRFYFTDGELCIQALLQPILLADHDLKVGDRIEVRDFVVRKARRLNGNGKIIYLGIQDFEILSQHNSEEWEGEGGFVRSEDEELSAPPRKRRKRNTNRVTFTGVQGPSDESNKDMNRDTVRMSAPKKRLHNEETGMDEEAESEDEFEQMDINLSQIQQRRLALHNLQQASAPTNTSSDDNDEPESPIKQQRDLEPDHPSLVFKSDDVPSTAIRSALTPPSTHPFLPTHNPSPLTPPYHALSSLLSPSLPTKNYPLTTLSIITYTSTSLLSKPNSPFPPKRNIRLIDPSLSPTTHPQGLTLAVYVDARTFLPSPGTIALFRGVVMQKFGKEVILNAYANLKDKPENEKWLVDDERVLEEMGFDVKGMRRWWEDRVSKNAKKSFA